MLWRCPKARPMGQAWRILCSWLGARLCVVGVVWVLGIHRGNIILNEVNNMKEINLLIAGKVSMEQEGLDLSEEASGTTHPILLETVE